MIVGYDSRTSNGTPPNTSNFLLGNGTLDASSITIAQANTGATGNTVNASMTVTGGTVTVGTLSLGTNQPSGDTLSGTLNLNTGSVLAAAAITPGSGTATRTFNWNDGTIENYRGDATYAETEGNLTISSGLTLTLANTGNHTFNIDPTFTGTVNAIIAGSGGTLVKANGGTLILSGTNSYSGSTTIAGGTLSLAPASGTNNIASSASIIVGAGATLKVADVGGSGANAFALHGTGAQSTSQILGGTGTVSGNVAVASGATLSAGTTPAVTTPNGGSVPATGTSAVVGTLSTGSLGLNGGGDLAIKVGNGQSTGTAFTAGTDFDSIAATGVLNAAGTFTIELLADGTGASSASTNFSPTTSYTFQIASFTGSTNIPNAGATPVILTAGGGKTVTSGDSNIFALDTSSFAAANGVSQTKFYLEEIGGSNGSLDVVYNAAPEPGTALLVVAGAAPIVRARRRRTRSRG
jgi:fibronectin-binding autotransporter adhesin